MGGFAGLKLIPLRLLRPHEQVVESHVEELINEIEADGVLRDPVYVDIVTGVILDGHHRTEALRHLGYKRIPSVLVYYFSPEVRVGSWRPDVKVTKREVIYRGLNGRKFPPKTSRHVFPSRLTGLNVPLSLLD